VCKCKFLQPSLTSAFLRDVDEICALLEYYTAYSGNHHRSFGPIFPIFKGQEYFLPFKMGPIGCPETSVINYHYSLCNSPEEHRFRLQRGGSLKSLISVVCSALAKIVRSNFHILVIKITTGQL